MSDVSTAPAVSGRGSLGEILANTVLAFALSFFAAYLGIALGLAPHVIATINLTVFFFIVLADPIGMLHARPRARALAAKAAASMGLGVFAMLLVPRFDSGLAGDVAVSGTFSDSALLLLRTLGPMLLLTPVLLFAPVLARMLQGPAAEAPVSKEEAKISAAFPVFVMLHLTAMLAVPGVLWLLDLPAIAALGLAVAAVWIALFETRKAPVEDWVADLEEAGWGAEPRSASEAWESLAKGVQALAASALFVGATIYLSILMAEPFLARFSLVGAPALTSVGAIAVGGCLVLGSFLALSALAVLILSAAAYALDRRRGAGQAAALARARHAYMRLFGGGMRYVRPNLPDDAPEDLGATGQKRTAAAQR